MPWKMNDYPSSMKNLEDTIRKKAIDIANTMVEEGYEESRAIPIAISQAEAWHKNAGQQEVNSFNKYGDPTETEEKYDSRPELLNKKEHVTPHDDGWSVKSEDAKQPSSVYTTKKEALQYGKKVAKNKGTSLIVHRKDGTIEDQISYTPKN